jgi:uncharacterized protein (DUF433 family)
MLSPDVAKKNFITAIDVIAYNQMLLYNKPDLLNLVIWRSNVKKRTRILIDDKIHFGKPVIKGTRIPVELIIGKLAGGMTFEEVQREYQISRDDLLAALDYAAKILSGEEIREIT